MEKIAVGSIVLPYSKEHPILAFSQDKPDLFLRARYHDQLGIWYSMVAFEDDPNPTSIADSDRGGGLVVFIRRVPKAGEAIRIAKILSDGSSARGTIIPLSVNVQCPKDHELK